MTIYKGSRYQRVPVYRRLVESGSTTRIIPTLRRRLNPEINSRESLVYQFKQGDRVDLLANQYYGDPQLWWVILDANPKYMTPWEIEPGDILLIPPLSSLRNGGV